MIEGHNAIPTRRSARVMMGLAAALVPVAALMYPAGGAYAMASGWCSPFLLHSLLYCQLLPGVVTAAIIGVLTFRWTRKGFVHARKQVILAVTFGLVVILGQGLIIGRAISHYEKVMPRVSADIERNLALLSSDYRWLPLFGWFPYPRLRGARWGAMLVGPRISVEFTSSGKMKSAHMVVLTVVDERDKQDVLRALAEFHVRPTMAKHLRWEGQWYAQHGRYSVLIMDH